MRVGWRGVLVLSIVVVGISFLLRPAFTPRVVEVDAVEAAAGPVEDLVANSEAGSVRTRSLARLSAERAGRIVRIPHREGTPVSRGEIVLALDATTAAAQLEVARRDRDAADAAHKVAHANAELERQRHQRADELRRRNLSSDEELEEARARWQASESELAAAEARLQSAASAERLARNELEHHVVRSPFAGVVTRRFSEIGESVLLGQTILEIADLEHLYVSAPIDERDAGRLTQGQPARVTVDAVPGASWPGVITRLASIVDETKDQNRTLEVEVEFSADPRRDALRPGMTADVEIVLERREGVLRVPTAAVVDGQRVLLVEGGRAATRPIVTGISNWEWTEVRSGLAAGDRVITTLDRPGLRAGARVEVRAPEPGKRIGGPDTVSRGGP